MFRLNRLSPEVLTAVKMSIAFFWVTNVSEEHIACIFMLKTFQINILECNNTYILRHSLLSSTTSNILNVLKSN
jgi:hypothetical protein